MPSPNGDETNWDQVPGFTGIQDAEALEAWSGSIEDEVAEFAHGTLGIAGVDIWDDSSLQVAERYLLQNATDSVQVRHMYVKYIGEGIRRIVDGTWVCLPSITDAPDKFGIRPRRSWPWQYLIPIAPRIDQAIDEHTGDVWRREFETIRDDGAA